MSVTTRARTRAASNGAAAAMDYKMVNSYGLDYQAQATAVRQLSDDIHSKREHFKIPPAQKAPRRPARGKGSGRGGRRGGRARTVTGVRGQQPSQPPPPIDANLSPHSSVSEYITEDEWWASEDELRIKIEQEKQKLNQANLLSELAGLRRKAGQTPGPFSGGSGRPRGDISLDQVANGPVDDRASAYQANRFQDAYQDLYSFARNFNQQDLAHQNVSNRPLIDFSDDGRDSSSEDNSFNLTSRDQLRGKPKRNTKNEQSFEHCDPDLAYVLNRFPQLFQQNNNNSKPKTQVSGIRDSRKNIVVIQKQVYPHSQLQDEFLWGYSGDVIDYKDLTFGLFVAGELEIITNPTTDLREALRRQELLKLTAYRSQYTPWSKLLFLHGAILQKIESGRATWESNFDSVEKMVLENPGKANWAQRLGMEKPGKKEKASGSSAAKQQGVLWCWDFNKGTCSKTSPHEAFIGGKPVNVKHICATCHKVDKVERNHSEASPDCPVLKRGAPSDSKK